MGAMTLRNGTRLKGWYGIKGMLCRIIWHIEKDLVAKRLKIRRKSCLHWNTWEN